MTTDFARLLATTFILSLWPLLGFSQAELPGPDLNVDQEWDIVHIYGDDKLSPKSIPLQEHMPSFTAEIEDLPFQEKLERYIQRILPTMKERKIRLVRFVADKARPFTVSQKTLIKETLKNYGLKPRFEEIAINWQKRQEVLIGQAMEKGDEVASEIVGQEAKAYFQENYRKGMRNFFSDIYAKPTKTEVTGGIIKMGTTAMVTTSGWMAMGISPTSPIFWVLSSKLFFTELLYGPYIKTYLNFLGKKVAKTFGDSGIAMYGQIQGFVLFSFDKFFLHLYDPINISGPWDIHFLANFFGLSFLGGMFGAYLPSGIFKLTTKGWLSRTAGSLNMQMLDLIMPLEGVFLAMDSPWLWPIFVVHNLVKFSYYVAGTVLPTRGQMLITTHAIAGTDEFLREIVPDQIIKRRYFNEASSILPYLESKQVPLSDKLKIIKYFVQQSRRLEEKGPEEQELLHNIFQAAAQYLESIKLANPEFHKDKAFQKLAKILERLPATYRPPNLMEIIMADTIKTTAGGRCFDYLKSILGWD